MEKSLLHRFSDSMQIESLWNFNKKYDPEWRPRYSVADDRAHMPRAGLAIARAESVSELPLVGKLMKPKTPVAPDSGAGSMTIRHWHLTRGHHAEDGVTAPADGCRGADRGDPERPSPAGDRGARWRHYRPTAGRGGFGPRAHLRHGQHP